MNKRFAAFPLISIVIATRNRGDLLAKTIEQFERQTFPGGSCELIVADNGSSDGTEHVVRSFGDRGVMPVSYIREERAGKSYALNTALSQARGKYVVFTDDDAVLPENWLEEIEKCFREDAADGVGGAVYAVWSGARPVWMPAKVERQIGIIDHGKEKRLLKRDECYIGPNSAYRREVFEKIGGMDPLRLGNSEDVDFYHRAHDAGFRLMYHPGIAVGNLMEPERWTKAAVRRRFWNQGRAIAYGVQESRTGRTLFRIPLWILKLIVSIHVAWLKAIFGGNREEAVWQWFRRYLYLGAAWYCLSDCLSGRAATHERPAIHTRVAS